jgi:hypothetical protein
VRYSFDIIYIHTHAHTHTHIYANVEEYATDNPHNTFPLSFHSYIHIYSYFHVFMYITLSILPSSPACVCSYPITVCFSPSLQTSSATHTHAHTQHVHTQHVHTQHVHTHAHVPAGSEGEKSARGPLTRGEYWHGRKEPQIRWVAERVRPMVLSGSVRHIVDIGERERGDRERGREGESM